MSKESNRTAGKAIETARRLFLELGWRGVNMEQIATEAGVARQTLYNRFGSKESLFRAAIDAHWASLRDASEATFDLDVPPRKVLADVAEKILAFVESSDQVAMTRMVIAESGAHPKIAQEFYERGKAPLIKQVVEYIRLASRAGVLDCDDPDIAAQQFLGMIQESLLWPRVMGTNAPLIDSGRIIDRAIHVFMTAYGGRLPEPRDE